MLVIGKGGREKVDAVRDVCVSRDKEGMSVLRRVDIGKERV